MFTKKLCKGLAVIVSTTVFTMSTIQSAYAAPGPLATAPLFLSTIVEPNVFFTIDDSGSMDWGPMVADGTAGLTASSGLPIIDNEDRAYYAHSFSRLYDGSRYVLPPADGTRANWDLGWVVRTHHGNLNYYNPAVTYTPWPGTNADGSPMFTDADPTNALKDPWNTGGESVDLTRSYNITAADAADIFDRNMAVNNFWIAVYFTWDDTDGDGVIEQTDGRTRVVIPTDSPGEMQNFANWFQYYRSRINATKAIIGSTINNTDASRMGMRLFNDDQLKDVESMGDVAKKRELLTAFYNYDIPAQGTPMRDSLHETGNYFRETGSDAPILSAANGGECQQNFNILMGDGFWNGNDPGVGNRDINGGDGNTPYDGNASQSNDGGNYADSWSDTLADVAMDNYESDLRTDLGDKVPTQPGIDEADHQHLVTYTIAFGITGTLDPANPAHDPLSASFPGWPDPDNGNEERVDDMWHAAYNGRGKFFSAQQPDELETALNAAIADIAERTATAAAVSINSAKLTTQSVVYLAQFNTNRWQGNLFAFKIVDLDTGELAATPEWTAADQLNARNIVTNPRTILSYNGTNGIPFQWTNLSAAQKDDLKTSPTGSVDADAIGLERLEYLRGDRTKEGTYRVRLSLLSDLVNSGPVFVGQPALNWPDTAPFPTATGSRYSDFKNGPAKTRAGMVYAGSNGGMMHGFAEADGEEKLAYIPLNLFSTAASDGLHYLTEPNYGHKYYNDLTPTVSDIYADLGNGTKWQTVLVSGQRGGGRGIFALDVTDPGAFSEANANNLVLWELSNDDDPDMGYTFSRPQIALTNAGTWVAIFGNGYNDTGDGKAKLFIVDIAKGADGAWAGGDYIKITTNSGATGDRNGLATPALADLDGNGTVDRIYAGDLKGQMWVFDLSGTSETAWTSAGASLLFTTKGDEPITSKPTLAKHPTVSNDGTNAPNVMVYFGSGQYLVNADKTNTDDNYFYGVWDRGDYNLDDGDLVEQTIIPAYAPERVYTRSAVDYLTGKYGWMVELPDNGERSVTSSVVRGGIVFFNSFVPVADPCSVGGYGFRFALDMITGGSPDEVAIDTNGDGVIDASDKASDGSGNTDVIAAIRQEGFLPEPVFIEDIAYTAEKPSKVKELPEPPTGRFGWQELIQ